MSIEQRRLGRTGPTVPVLGFGAMDTPTSPEGLETVCRALDLGIRFVDTARDYEGSEFLLARAIRERGAGDVVLASKTFSRSADGSQWDVDRSLKVLGVESIQLYQLHDVRTDADWEQVIGPAGALEGLNSARYRGLIGHIGISTHNLEIGRRAILSGVFDTIMLEYSAFYPDSAPLLKLAAEHDVGVIAMRPLGGSGRMSVIRRRMEADPSDRLSPANLLRYVISNPNVSVAIPGARFPDRVEANLAAASESQPFGEDERTTLERLALALY